MKATAKNTRNKRAEKKQINIKWNSRLFFQIGVIASLLVVFFVMQANFELNVAEFKQPTYDGIEEPPMKEYVIDVDLPKPAEPIKKIIEKRVPIPKVVASNSFVVKPNASTDVETPIAATDAPVVETPAPPSNATETFEDTKPKNMLNVEFVPVFPGCESLGSNAEKVECMSSKINSFINKNFRKGVLEGLNANETYKIYVNFKIDSKGYVTDVRANAHNENLKKEAQRVINNLPTMKPGKQGNRNVDVLYTVPITFNIQ
ncbi:energy transducer TonB [Aequorivita todarodis]|uniref:energy transducer TonB n=1 Tax=Aequorivita todarodis TaxID=2036821 RepID=UPI002350BCFB|nr:energy transducer TonB [Aequorivita todarodis]MDC7999433.1 energy transducer TonB [Aequorivita todarodis]